MGEESIFAAALGKAPGEERRAFLDEACGGDDDLRRRVERLLEADRLSGGILDRAEGATNPDQTPRPDDASPAATATAEHRPIAESGLVIAGRYTLQERIGEGGMGDVWVAKQSEPVRRKVALKLIKPGMDSRAVLARFEQERQALALMDHPNIARVFDGGLTPTGQPFFVMELVNGLPLTRFCDEARLSPRERLELFVPICQAVQHAHQKGIVHRDLKPANILVTLIDGNAVPKVIDFGVAKATAGKLTDASMSTQFGSVVGTLEYMAPEQAGYSGEDVDTRADIYSLGVILYELLTGLRPIDARRLKNAAITEMIRIIREEEPSKPSTRLSTDDSLPSLAAVRRTEPRRLTAMLRGELDWMVMKCLEKARERRYETASGLARDIQHYLADEPVEACPPSTAYKLRKFVRKNRKALVTAVTVLVLLAAAAVVSTWQAIRAMRAEVEAKANAEKARLSADEAKRSAQQARDEANAKAMALRAEQQARADETKARQRAFAALRSLTAEVVERKFGQATALTDDDRAFLRGVIAQFDAFAAIKGNDADSRAARAEGRYRVGNIRHRLGDFKEAEQDFDQALSIYTQLAADFPSRQEFRQELATTHSLRAALLSDRGRPREAEQAYDQAVNISERLAADFPSQPEVREALARIYSNRGSLRNTTGRPGQAEQDYDQALRLYTQLAANSPSRPEYRMGLAAGHNNRAILLCGMGRLREAEDAYNQALGLKKQLAVEVPSRPDFRLEVASTLSNLANLLFTMGRPEEAERDYDEAVRISTPLAADFPSRPEFHMILARSHLNRGHVLSSTGRLREAEQDVGQALSIYSKLAAHFPFQPEYRSDLANSHGARGNLLSDLGRFQEAALEFDRSLIVGKQLVADFPSQPDLRSRLGNTFHNLALVYLRQGNFAAAKPPLLEGRPHHLAALKVSPRSPAYCSGYIKHLELLAQAHAGLLEQADAVHTAEACRDLRCDPPTDAYNAACLLGRCYPIVAKHDKLNDKQRQQAVQFYGDAAMKLLREAVGKGFKNVEHMKQDTDLDPLRQRDDFQKLVAELEAATAPRTSKPGK